MLPTERRLFLFRDLLLDDLIFANFYLEAVGALARCAGALDLNEADVSGDSRRNCWFNHERASHSEATSRALEYARYTGRDKQKKRISLHFRHNRAKNGAFFLCSACEHHPLLATKIRTDFDVVQSSFGQNSSHARTLIEPHLDN